MEEYLRFRWRQLAGATAGDRFLAGRGSTESLVALIVELQRAGFPVTLRDLLRSRTVPALAELLGARGPGWPSGFPSFDEVWSTGRPPAEFPGPSDLVRLAAGVGKPLFFVHNGLGSVRFAQPVTDHYRQGRPVYGIEVPGLRRRERPPLTVPEFADRYLRQIRAVQPHGPYWLGGFCFGSQIAFEMAHRLADAGEEIGALTILNSIRPGIRQRPPGWGLADLYLERLAYVQLLFGDVELGANLPAVLETLEKVYWLDGLGPDDFYWHSAVTAATAFAQEHYDPRPYPGPVLVFQPSRVTSGDAADWSPVAPQVNAYSFDAGDSPTLMTTPEFAHAVAG